MKSHILLAAATLTLAFATSAFAQDAAPAAPAAPADAASTASDAKPAAPAKHHHAVKHHAKQHADSKINHSDDTLVVTPPDNKVTVPAPTGG